MKTKDPAWSNFNASSDESKPWKDLYEGHVAVHTEKASMLTYIYWKQFQELQEEVARGFEPGSFALGKGGSTRTCRLLADVGADFGMDERTLLQAIRSLEKGDEGGGGAAGGGECEGAEPKPLRRSPRTADGGGAADGGSSSKRTSQQTLLKPTEKQQKVAECWI